MKSIVLLALFGAVAVTAIGSLDLTTEQSERLFAEWRKEHNKQYSDSAEAIHRFGVFMENMKWIHATNNKDLPYTVGLNQFADLTSAEFRALLGTRPAAAAHGSHHKRIRHSAKPRANPPASWDWRQHNAVNPVQNQGQCGSCWAFTSGDSISGLWAIKTGMLFPVSVQEIMDCSGSQGNEGCNGGEMSAAFQWVVDNGGICDWAEYQYTASDGNCAMANCTSVARITGLVNIDAGDEASLMPATWGQPISLAVEADQQSFQFYQSGVLNDPACGTNVDHGVTLIGWGTDPTSKLDYWQVRNMWGTTWGEQGYIRIARGKNICGVAEAASYPTLNL